eukprot:2015490-Amphidinium_carterae.3
MLRATFSQCDQLDHRQQRMRGPFSEQAALSARADPCHSTLLIPRQSATSRRPTKVCSIHDSPMPPETKAL